MNEPAPQPRCPFCGGAITAMVDAYGVWEGLECVGHCWAEWDRSGELTLAPRDWL